MPTIDELMANKTPGQVKICRNGWAQSSYFSPYYRLQESKTWHGIDEVGENYSAFDGGDWHIYVEPKPKTILHEVLERYYMPQLQRSTFRPSWYEFPPAAQKNEIIITGKTMEVEL